jgi:hypothetical protein
MLGLKALLCAERWMRVCYAQTCKNSKISWANETKKKSVKKQCRTSGKKKIQKILDIDQFFLYSHRYNISVPWQSARHTTRVPSPLSLPNTFFLFFLEFRYE